MAFLDTTAFFADFGLTATVGGASVRGMFDAAYQEAFGLVGGSRPVFKAATADVSSASRGTAVVISGTSYTVGEVQPDGTGMTLLVLDAV